MKGLMTNKARYIRVDIRSKDELSQILNSGVFPIAGYLLDEVEFLAPPQNLIWTRCSYPGHTKKNVKKHMINVEDVP